MGKQLEKASNGLEEVAKKAEIGDDKSDSSKNLIREAVEAAKTTLSTLRKYLEDLKDIGDASQKVGEAATSDAIGVTPDDVQLKSIFRALKGIVEIATTSGGVKKALEAGSKTLTTDNKVGAKILSTNSSGGTPGVTAADKAAIILTAVSGEEILKSIIDSQESDGNAELSGNADGNASALAFAKGGQTTRVSNSDQAKAAAVAGGIALRSLVKKGKLGAGAAESATGGGKEVQAVGIDAVSKLLKALENIIRKTVKNVIGWNNKRENRSSKKAKSSG